MSPTVARPRAAPPRPCLGTRPALDGLRGAAVLAVLSGHVGQFVLPGHDFWPMQGGFLGVDVFLVLSGFLITALLLAEVDRTGGIRMRRFFGRRATRLLPALLVLLAAHWVYILIIGASVESELRATVLALTFTSNWEATMGLQAGAEIPLDLTHLWTLAVEGQFYLVWPVVLLALTWAWSSPHRLLAVIGCLIVGVAVVRAVSFAVASDWSLVYTRFDTRLDSLLVGALLAVLWTRGHLPAGRWRTVGAAVGCVLLGVAFMAFEPVTDILYYGGFTVVAVAAALVIAAALHEEGRVAGVLGWRPLRAIGLASYSLYLWHLPVFIWAVSAVDDQGPLRLVVALGVTAVLATASYLLVERPVMARRGRLRPSTPAR